MVDFHNWHMPLHYGSQLAEHHAVRQSAGVFDVSHMTIIDIAGSDALAFLRWLLPSDVARRARVGRALYSALLNEQGGVIDDLVLYFLPDSCYRLITNCATQNVVLLWLDRCRNIWQSEHSTENLSITKQQGFSILAVQGPQALQKCMDCMPEYSEQIAKLTPFSGILSKEVCLAYTGYTGENGLEIMLPDVQAVELWQALLARNVQPAGLGARDTLRLEAGLNLYGQDMNEHSTPLTSNMRKILHWQPAERDFLGRAALLEHKSQGVPTKLTGLVLQTGGVPRQGYQLYADEQPCGMITSGGMSPTLKCGIALARVAVDTPEQVAVDIRGKRKPARLTAPPFYRKISAH